MIAVVRQCHHGSLRCAWRVTRNAARKCRWLAAAASGNRLRHGKRLQDPAGSNEYRTNLQSIHGAPTDDHLAGVRSPSNAVNFELDGS